MKQNSSARDVESILNQLNIYYEKEKTFDDLKYKSKLRFDYYLPQYHLCIEFNGIQHYEYVEYFHRNEDMFKEQLFKDDIKRKYCQAHNIHLIELPCSLTSDEIRAELVQFINEHSDKEVDLLPEIESFLKLNESHTVYINQLYDEYKRMLKDLIIDDISNYKIFYNYVIDYWDLKDKSIIRDKKGKYIECWINENDKLNEQMNDKDIVYQFVEDLENNEILYNQKLPTSILYQAYRDFSKQINPSAAIKSQMTFTKTIESYLEDKDFELIRARKTKSYLEKSFNYTKLEDYYYIYNIDHAPSTFFQQLNNEKFDDEIRLVSRALNYYYYLKNKSTRLEDLKQLSHLRDAYELYQDGEVDHFVNAMEQYRLEEKENDDNAL